MKTTDKFKETIQNALNMRAFSDKLFAVTLAKENKNIDDCILYILNTVQKSGSNGFEDSEIIGMAVHYYDEDDIKVTDGAKNMKVVVNHQVVLTSEERADAKTKAIADLVSDERAKLVKRTPKPKTTYNASGKKVEVEIKKGEVEPGQLF